MTTRPTGADLIGATLLFSLLLHGIVILGITFRAEPPRPSVPTLDVTLVDVANQEPPDKADFLAQANNSGGGDQDKAARPSERVSGPLPTPQRSDAVEPKEARAPAPREAQPDTLLTTSGQTAFTVNTDKQQVERKSQPLPEADEDTQRQTEMAKLAAEVRDQSQAYAKRPKKKYISSNTREYAYAAYMKGWVGRVERVGNLNYPDEARRQGLYGELVLTVGLNRDGSIKSIDVIKSSGHPLLDEAAQRIVRLAAPFPALPADKTRVDELYITRTWQFLPGNVLRNY
ncbi:energy transducer TonB [Luteibacter sp. UNCMF366Tsu5.1]|uniref:energy transducer TonB n=1 Tax=Luteibacter sp. UNCMF366Tsu5.1 TaxID=1502758 RepID=UPI0009086417|nr:energy transducer TonB [Luteibacter sp. UNCMF366Tsu5.1]SFW36441.1 protein TonB [Luteibacter sp. UNCMF366Tsu5.1]